MRILSIDGGGIRGIIPGQVLVALEKILQQKDPSKPRLADWFDLIAGTSTGGILTCLYLFPDETNPTKAKYSAQQAVDLYLENGDDIFDVSIFKSIASLGGIADEKYSAETLEKVLFRYMGETRLSQLVRPCLVTAYDIFGRNAKFFNKADFPKKPDFLLRDVARATSAAPTYFEPANIAALDKSVYPLVDGGVFANNPAMCACVEAFGLNPNLRVSDLKVLSLGTGSSEEQYHYSEAKNWGKIGWVGPVLSIMMSGVSETVHYQLEKLFGSANCSKQYLRLQVDLKTGRNADFKEEPKEGSKTESEVDSAMDNASAKNMRALEKLGKEFAAASAQQLTDFADLL